MLPSSLNLLPSSLSSQIHWGIHFHLLAPDSLCLYLRCEHLDTGFVWSFRRLCHLRWKLEPPEPQQSNVYILNVCLGCQIFVLSNLCAFVFCVPNLYVKIKSSRPLRRNHLKKRLTTPPLSSDIWLGPCGHMRILERCFCLTKVSFLRD